MARHGPSKLAAAGQGEFIVEGLGGFLADLPCSQSLTCPEFQHCNLLAQLLFGILRSSLIWPYFHLILRDARVCNLRTTPALPHVSKENDI